LPKISCRFARAASPDTDAVFLEAHRAVSEVLERRAFPVTVEGDDPAKA
jgi:hypothetical protein